jgi:DNA repair exonuclease SbcCD nuclease subunit
MDQKLKILHTADWHVCDEFLGDAVRCLEFLVAEAENQQPHFIFISGDIYNHRQIRQESNAAQLAFMIIRKLANIAPVFILAGTPSHDGKAPKVLAEINEDFPVWVEGQPNFLFVYKSPLGEFKIDSVLEPKNDFVPMATVSCVPAFTKQYFQTKSDIETADQEIAKELGAIFGNFGVMRNEVNKKLRFNKLAHPIPHILMGHWTIGGSFVHPSQALTGLDIEVARDHIALANPDIVCMGHIHAQQKIGQNIFYPGSLFATDFGEHEAKGFYIHELELVDLGGNWEITDSDFVLTPSPVLVKLTTELFKAKTDDTANLVMRKTLEGVTSNPNAIIRYEVKIYQDMAHTIDREMIEKFVAEKIGPRKFDLQIVRMPRPNVRSARVIEVESLRDKLKTRAEIIEEPITDPILEKADLLENTEPEELLSMVQKGVQL